MNRVKMEETSMRVYYYVSGLMIIKLIMMTDIKSCLNASCLKSLTYSIAFHQHGTGRKALYKYYLHGGEKLSLKNIK